MKEIPILFSTPMVQALLEGTKTQTRRIITSLGVRSRYGELGDLLLVKETISGNGEGGFYYLADEKPIDAGIIPKTLSKKKNRYAHTPSIFMPKQVARIWLEVQSVKAEKCCDITDKDAIAEGIAKYHGGPHGMRYKLYDPDESGYGLPGYLYKSTSSPRESFRSLWDLINPKISFYDAIVWVIEFKVLSTTGKPELKTEKELSI